MKRLTMCLAVLGLLLGATGTSSGASISFTPEGAQIVPTKDDIFDIATKVGDKISFKVFIDTKAKKGVPPQPDEPLPFNLTDFSYTASWDSEELTFIDVTLDAGGNFAIDTAPRPIPRPSTGTWRWQASHSMGEIKPDTDAFLLDTWNFTVGPKLKDDGTFDFRVDLDDAQSISGKFRQGMNTYYTKASQEVEVQSSEIPEPSTPALLTTALAGIGMGYWPRRKRAHVTAEA